MINWNTILSSFNNKPTLLQWLKKVEAALKNGSLTNVSIVAVSDKEIKLKFIFADNTFIESDSITISGGEQMDAFDLLALIKPSAGIIADISEDNTQVELHLDQTFINTLATKEDLKTKQDKLSQVDLDNIAMINQYGQDINNLKEKTKVIDNTAEVLTIPVQDTDVKNGFANFGISNMKKLAGFIEDGNESTEVLQKIKLTYKGVTIEQNVLLNNYFKNVTTGKNSFSFSMLKLGGTDNKDSLLISGTISVTDKATGTINVSLKIEGAEAGGGGGSQLEQIWTGSQPINKFGSIPLSEAQKEKFKKHNIFRLDIQGFYGGSKRDLYCIIGKTITNRANTPFTIMACRDFILFMTLSFNNTIYNENSNKALKLSDFLDITKEVESNFNIISIIGL